MSRLSIFLFLLVSLFAKGQSVSINLNVSPPFTPYMADYLGRGQHLTLQLKNNGREAVALKLLLSFTGDNGVSIRTRPSYSPTRPLMLNPGEVKILKSLDEFRYYVDGNNLDVQGISINSLRIGGLPEGSYQLCLQAVDYTTGRSLSFSEPLGCSNSITIRYVEPPVVTYPLDNAIISGPRSKPIAFTWVRPVGLPANAVYTFRLAELPDVPGLNPNAYIDAQTIPTYEQKTIQQSLLVYNATLPPLKPGKRYALRVTASDPQGKVAFQNEGHSVVTTFLYAPD